MKIKYVNMKYDIRKYQFFEGNLKKIIKYIIKPVKMPEIICLITTLLT